MDTATAQIDAFIERRSQKSGADRAEEMAWKASVRRYNRKLERTRAAEWYAYHADQAERLRRTMEPLIAFHEARAQKLLEAK